MIKILMIKLRLLLRKPIPFISTTVLLFMLTLLMGSGHEIKIKVPVYSEHNHLQESTIWKELEKSKVFDFQWSTKEKVEKLVSEGKAEAGIELKETDFRLIISSNTENVNVIHQYVHSIYSQELIRKNILTAAENSNIDTKQLEMQLDEVKEKPIFETKQKLFRSDDTVIINDSLHSIFGFSLFMVIYTIAYNVLHILEEKKGGMWDRMILSPLKKWEMYTGNLLFSFITGYFQVVIVFAVFYFTGVEFYGGFWKTLIILIPYVFCIVALSIFITGLVKNIQQFNAIIPLVAVSFAMIGGAYWPLEIVTSKVLLTVSKFDPITYGMEALKGVTIYGMNISDLMYPISILVLMGVILIGIGINLMEKRHV